MPTIPGHSGGEPPAKAIALLVVGLASLLPPLERAETADLILCSRTTITVDARDRVEEALAARNGVIHTVGSHRESKALGGPGCKLIDPQGRTAPPGLIDAHSLPFYPSVLGPALPTPLAS